MFQEKKGKDLAIGVSSRKEWRSWLRTNHGTEISVWLILFRKGSSKENLSYEEAVEEALAKAQVAADAAEVASEDLVKAVTDFEELQEKGAQVFKTVERKNEWARPPPALPTGTGSEGSSTTG